ncbi:hypothetical protein ACHAXT_001815 [Thalassiosira profunda]
MAAAPSDGADAAASPAAEPSPPIEAPPPAISVATEPATLLTHLSILPPRQQTHAPHSSSAAASLPDEDPVALPPLRTEEPVASLRAALSELRGYAALTKYRFVVERAADGGGKQATAATTKRGNNSNSNSNHNNNSNRNNNHGGGKRHSKRGPKSKSKGHHADAPCHSPFCLVGAEVSPRPPHGPLGGTGMHASSDEGGEEGGDSGAWKGSGGAGEEREWVLDDYGDLAPLLALLETDEGASNGNDNNDSNDNSSSDNQSPEAPHHATTVDCSRLALRIVLEPHDAASVREEVERARALLGGNAPCVDRLIEEEEEETGKNAEGKRAAAEEGKRAEEAKEKEKEGGGKGEPESKEDGTPPAPPALDPLPVDRDLRFAHSARAGDLSHFYRLACGDEGSIAPTADEGEEGEEGEGGAVATGPTEAAPPGAQRASAKMMGKAALSITDEDVDALVAQNDARSRADIERILRDLNISTCIDATVRYSGHHPPPPHRRLAGDLAYLAVTFPDGGKCEVTAVPRGFYINNSTPATFDPTPVRTDPIEACFSHSLLDCLLLRSKSLRGAWRKAVAASAKRAAVQARLSIVESAPAALLRVATSPFGETGPGIGPGGAMAPAPRTFVARVDGAVARPPWLVALPSNEGVREEGRARSYDHAQLHSYDPCRAAEELAANHGGASAEGMRDWNEELQAAREMPAGTLPDRIERARLIHKVLSDFGDAALRGVGLISTGALLPMNPHEPSRSHVHLFDHIFFSRALDPGPDTFKIVRGDGAARKTASRDAHNTGVLHRLDVPGLHTLAVVLVEYAGARWVCQSIVPGILHGDKAHTLLCGAVETLSALRCDDEMRTLLEGSLGEHCMVAARNVPAHPLTDERMAALRRHRVREGSAEREGGNNDDEEENPPPTSTVRVCGPVEMKGIRGSDGRRYVLDCARLTPRDANWVDESSGGTGNWEAVQSRHNGDASERVPATLDDDEWTACILRPELVTAYAEVQMGKFLKESATKGAADGGGAAHEGEKDGAEKKEEDDDDEAATTEAAGPAAAPEEDKEWVDVASKRAAAQRQSLDDATSDQPSKEAPNKIAEEYLRSLRYNVNVFLPFARSLENIDAAAHAQLQKDEEEARHLARYLWDAVIPQLTADARKCGANGAPLPTEGRALTELLHARGINCRYLGRLAELARREEADDVAAAKRAETARAVARKLGDAATANHPATERITAPRFRMPLGWREQLECEMVARAAKRVLDAYLTDDRAGRPVAQTVASFLSAVMSTGEEGAAETEARTSKEEGEAREADAAGALSLFDGALGNRDAAAAFGRDDVWAAIEREVGRRYRCTLSLYSGTRKDGGDSGRALYLPLLRRICQRSGIRLVAKRYDVGKKCVCGGGSGGGPTASYPVAPTDVLDVLPLVKHGGSVAGESFLPTRFGAPNFAAHGLHVLLPEAAATYQLGHAHLAGGNAAAAVECAREASGLYQRVVDTPVHPQVAGCLRLLAAARLHSGADDDVGPALAAAERCLSVAVALHGFDSSEALRARLKLADLLLGVGKFAAGVRQLRAAQYLMELLGGRHCAGLAASHFRLGTVHFEGGRLEDALRFFRAAAACRCEDRLYECLVARNTSGVLCRLGSFKAAFECEKRAHELYAAVLGEEHDATRQCAHTLIQLMNLAIEQDKQLKLREKERQQERAANDAAEVLRADEAQRASEEVAAAKPKKRKNKKKRGKK